MRRLALALIAMVACGPEVPPSKAYRHENVSPRTEELLGADDVTQPRLVFVELQPRHGVSRSRTARC